MMTRQARSSAVIMGFDTHMILEAVPARLRYAATCIRPSIGHHATMPGPWPVAMCGGEEADMFEILSLAFLTADLAAGISRRCCS
jgi:hypothetical protein